jgi:hypothetical protein
MIERAVSSPSVAPKCKCAVNILPPGCMRRPPDMAIERARSGRRSPQGVDAVRRRRWERAWSSVS